jgi:DNA-binding LytR/AlgR family response regulator
MPAQELSILIVEDDFSFSLELEILVKDIGYKVLGTVDNSAEALELIYAEHPDLILMDIDIKGKLTGIEIAEKVQHLNIPILFITSIKQESHYNRAKQTNFIGYMVKPVEEYSLRSSIELAVKNLNLQKNGSKSEEAFPFKEDLFFKKRGIFKKINIHSIDYIEADGNYSATMANNEKLVTSLTLTELECLLKEYHFMRIHRRYIINLKKISHLDLVNNKIAINQSTIPISRAKKGELVKMMKILQ